MPALSDAALDTLADVLTRAGERATALARRLAGLGLNPRAVRGCFGVTCVGHAARRAADPARPGEPAAVPAALVPLLFVAGRRLPVVGLRRRLGDDFDLLDQLGLIARDGDQATATLGLLPIGDGLVACEHPADLAARPDLPGGGAFPDDSTFHLLGALPARRVDSWLDVGTGNAAAPLGRRGLAATVLATDVDPRALRFAAIGRALSGTGALQLARADLLAAGRAGAPWSLISFNAPIPGSGSGSDLLARFWREVPSLVAADGEVVVHSQQAEDHPAAIDLPGLIVAVRYTPSDHRPGFGVTRWCPAGPSRRLRRTVDLSLASPHIRRTALEIA